MTIWQSLKDRLRPTRKGEIVKQTDAIVIAAADNASALERVLRKLDAIPLGDSLLGLANDLKDTKRGGH